MRKLAVSIILLASTVCYGNYIYNPLISDGLDYYETGVSSSSVDDRFTAVGVATASLRTDLTAGFVAVGVATASLKTDLISVGVATASLKTDILAVGLTTASLRTDITALGVSTGSLQTQVNALGVSTGSLQTQVTALGVSTGSLQTQVTTLGVSTGSLQTQITATALSTQTLADAVGLSTASLQTQITATALSTQTLANAVGLTTASLQTQITATALSTQTLASAVGTATASLKTDILAVGLTTASLKSDILAVGLTTASLKSDILAVGLTTASLKSDILAIGLTTASLRTDLTATALSTQTLANAIGLTTATLASNFPVSLSTNVMNNLPVTSLNSGTGATSSTFWRGDGTWVSSATFGGSGSGGDNLGSHIATMTVTANYGLITSTVVASSVTVNGIVQITSNTTRGNPTLSVTYSGVSNNLNKGMVDIYRSDPGALAGDDLLSIGSNLQPGQFRVRDSFPLYLGDFGARVGNLNVGLASFLDKVMSVNDPDQHINFWSSGDLIIQSGDIGDGGRDIIFKPRTFELVRISTITGFTVLSSSTFNHTLSATEGILTSTVNVTGLSASLPVQTDASKNLTSAAIDLSGSQATGALAAGRFPALTGDITTSAGALATTAAANQQNITSIPRVLSLGTSTSTVTILGQLTINIGTNTVIMDNSQSYVIMPSTGFAMTADSSTLAAVLSNVPGMGFAMGPTETWEIRCQLRVGSSTAGAKYGINAPSGATVSAVVVGNTSAITTFTSVYITALNTATAAFATAGITDSIRIQGIVTNGSTAGPWTLQFQSTTGAQPNAIFKGSYCTAKRIL